MTSDYKAIFDENRRRYGTDIGRIGPMLLADRYDDRTHFLFELLQNAEDALSRRGTWNGQRRVTFDLTPKVLILRHFGKPFDEADVRGICGIAESTKDRLSIGRFGIGFKSVYTFTDRPEIHSGEEDFAVENYVQPIRVDRLARQPDETQIILTLKSNDETAQQEITEGFKHLGPRALLFLRHINEINWSVQGGASGVYLRSNPETLGSNVQRINVIGQQSGETDIDQNWLVFHRNVFSTDNEMVGRVEIAFSLEAIKDEPGRLAVHPVVTSPLVVFFPTVVSTNLGFLVQGPYRTTPSRDNIPRGDAWNQHLVKETANLVVESMRWLRENKMLETSVLRCLPLDREKFPEGSMFAPLFDTVRQAFMGEPLLPGSDGGYISAGQAKLARSQELRELFSSVQVAMLFEMKKASWLRGDITQDRAPEIRQYLMRELGIAEVTPIALIPRLSREFLEAQSDEWILRLYGFLSGQEAALRYRLNTIPLIRLEDGRHVLAQENGAARAFLPSTIKTEFPTMRRAVCSTIEVRNFLISLGVKEPDPVDDVIWNVLPKYQKLKISLSGEQYAADIERMRSAFNTDSKIQREKLLNALRETTFVMAVNTGNEKNYYAKPSNIYIATDRLKQLFAGVPKVMIVNDSYDCLRGENMRELLEACGALRYPRPEVCATTLTGVERQELRRQAGHPETSGYSDRVVDWELQGFDELINVLSALSPEDRAERAKIIWESLGDLEERRGRGIFDGTYSWTHHGSYKKDFPASFLRKLNTAKWVPDAKGELHLPSLVVFDSLGWKPHPFLQSKIFFKPPILDQLAKESGIDPAALDLLKKLGITSVAELTSRLGIIDLPAPIESDTKTEPTLSDQTEGDVYDNANDLYGDDMPDIPPGTYDPDGGDGATTGGSVHGGQGGSGRPGTRGGNVGGADGRGQGKRSPGQSGGRPFISYLGTHPGEEEHDPDGLDQAKRMKIEEHAIALITELEPALLRTPAGNPGFDLYKVDGGGKAIRWIEVKSMTGSLEDRPVGISRKQFECAQEKGDAYWLYVVEHATDREKTRILRIQNPVARAQTFTFDRGWSQIARLEPLT